MNKKKKLLILSLFLLPALYSCRMGAYYELYMYRPLTSNTQEYFWSCLRKNTKEAVEYVDQNYHRYRSVSGRARDFHREDGYIYTNYNLKDVSPVHTKNLEVTKKLVSKGYNADDLFNHIAEYGSVASFKYLLHHPNLKQKPTQIDFQRIFELATNNSNFKLAIYICKKYRVYLYRQDPENKVKQNTMSLSFKNALISDYSNEFVSIFIKKGVFIPFKDEDNTNIFCLLAKHKSNPKFKKTLQLIIEYFKDTKKNTDFHQAYRLAAENENYVFFQLMRKHFKIKLLLKPKEMGRVIGYFILKLMKYQPKPLLNFIQFLFKGSKYSPDLNVRFSLIYGNYTPLIVAVKANDLQLVRFLISHKAKVNFSNNKKETPLFYAVKNNNYKIVELLISHQANVNRSDDSKKTPLFYAVKNNNYKMIKLLISHKANVNRSDDSKESPLFYAVKNNNYKIVELLISRKANVNWRDNYKESPLFYAVKNNNYKMAELLASHKANLNGRNKYKKTPLFYAVKNNNYKMAELLASHKANLNRSDDYKKTPLFYAVENNNYKMAELLASHKANLNRSDDYEKTPLFYAVENNNYKIAKLLVSYNANVNWRDDSKKTPLFYAVENNNYKIVELLISHNANVNWRDDYKESPLFYAVKNNNYKMIKLLISHKANVRVKNLKGQTVLSYAVEKGYKKIIELLKEKKTIP